MQAQYDDAVVQAAAARDAFEQRLSDAAAALEGATQERAADVADAADRLARRETELGATLAESAAARRSLEQTLADAEAAHQHAQQHLATELVVAAERLSDLGGRLARETAARAALEQRLGNAEAARQNADERHASELAAAAARAADMQAKYDDAQARYEDAAAQATAARDALAQQLSEAVAALDDSRQLSASEAVAARERLTHREAEFSAALAEAVAARSALEQTMAETEAAHQLAQGRAAAELLAAAVRETTLKTDLQHEVATRQELEGTLAGTRLESARVRRRFFSIVSNVRGRARARKARLDAQVDQERVEQAQRISAKDDEIRQIELKHVTLQQSLAATVDELQRLHETSTGERESYERARVASASDFQRLSAEHGQVRETLDNVRAALETLEIVASQHVAERARLERVLAERDGQLSAQATHLVAVEHASEEAAAQAREKLRLALETSGRDVAQLQRQLDALREELDVTRAQRETLKTEAGRVPDLQKHLEASQREHRTQFERAPYGMCRFTSDGAVTHVNRALVRLLGYRSADDLRTVDFATTVFESADDMRWLIECCLSTGTTEPVETTWRHKDRSRVVVRLQAAPGANQSVELVAEDITTLRTVEDQLRRAQRMEAVGRLASEVAVTCDTLLRDVTQEGEQWLAAIGSDPMLRQQGEQLLREVTRAASFLRQLGVYGSKQVSALEPVTVHRVLRDLQGVLKRVAGDDIELILPRTSPPVEVDVDAERVERVLVNVASYARERMPRGGRLKIELANAVVDRRFIAKYPNVRPGSHVLVTVTEMASTARLDSSLGLALGQAGDATGAASDKPGVDLGPLLGLIGECGGHLWVTAEPPGNMVLKIHLPTRASSDTTGARAPATPAGRGRSMARWFRH